MDDEKFSQGKTVNDLNIISNKLDKVVHYKKKEIKDIQSVQKNVDALSSYWKAKPVLSNPLADVVLASGSAFVHEFRSYVENINPEDFRSFVLKNVVASGDSITSVGMTLFHIDPPPEPVRKELEKKFIEIKNAPKRKEQQKKIKLYLEKISPHLAIMYDGVWENLHTNFSDPERGAAFLMREVISQLLDFLAPKKEIKQQVNFTPNPRAKDGVTRRHRLEYIATYKTNDNSNKKLIEKSTKSFLDTYDALCDAHKREALDKLKIESFLMQANDLLILILSAIKCDHT